MPVLRAVSEITSSANQSPYFYFAQNYGADFTWRTHLVCPPAEEECSYSDGGKSYDLRLLTSRTRSWYYEHNKDRYLERIKKLCH